MLELTILEIPLAIKRGAAILNTLARLGWSKGDKEIFYLNDLIKDFDIKEVQKAGAIFDISKLDWLNSQHLANLSLEDFKNQLEPFLEKLNISINDHHDVDLLIQSMRTSDNTYSGIAESLIPYYREIESYDEKAITKFIKDKSILNSLKDVFVNIDNWNENSIDIVLKEFQTQNELSVPAVNQPIRIALTGSTKSPSLGLTLAIFGKEKSIERVNHLLDHL